MKEYILYDSIHMILCIKKNYRERKKIRDGLGLVERLEVNYKGGMQGDFHGEGTIQNSTGYWIQDCIHLSKSI